MEDSAAFDLQRMFLGDNFSGVFLVEIAFRTAFMYVTALLLVRFLGKRGLGQISPFEYVVVIAMGSAAGDPMFYADVPLLHGVIVLAAIVLLEKGVLSISERHDAVNRFVESSPALLVVDGVVLERAVHGEGLARNELFEKLREAGVSNTAQVRLAYLEPSGNLSVFRFEESRPETRGESTLPETPTAQAV